MSIETSGYSIGGSLMPLESSSPHLGKQSFSSGDKWPVQLSRTLAPYMVHIPEYPASGVPHESLDASWMHMSSEPYPLASPSPEYPNQSAGADMPGNPRPKPFGTPEPAPALRTPQTQPEQFPKIESTPELKSDSEPAQSIITIRDSEPPHSPTLVENTESTQNVYLDQPLPLKDQLLNLVFIEHSQEEAKCSQEDTGSTPYEGDLENRWLRLLSSVAVAGAAAISTANESYKSATETLRHFAHEQDAMRPSVLSLFLKNAHEYEGSPKDTNPDDREKAIKDVQDTIYSYYEHWTECGFPNAEPAPEDYPFITYYEERDAINTTVVDGDLNASPRVNSSNSDRTTGTPAAAAAYTNAAFWGPGTSATKSKVNKRSIGSFFAGRIKKIFTQGHMR